MFIHQISDVHNEFQREDLLSKFKSLYESYSHIEQLFVVLKATTLVIAGDFCELIHPEICDLFNWLSETYKHVVYVPGNHEYYRTSIEEGNKIFTLLRRDNVYPLRNEIIELDGFRFVGTPLWFRSGYPYGKAKMLNDFHYIVDAYNAIPEENKNALAFLEENLKEDDILITHHLPSNKSVTPEYVGDEYNCFYVCAIDDLLLERKPCQVFHGHSHTKSVAKLGAIPITSNPMDYPKFGSWPKGDDFFTFTNIQRNEDGTVRHLGQFKYDRPKFEGDKPKKDPLTEEDWDVLQAFII